MFKVRFLPSRFLLLLTAATVLFMNPPDAVRGGGFGKIVVVDTTTNIQAADGLCSLPEAIIATNTNSIYFDCDASLSAGPDSIRFALGAGTPVINIGVGVPLPAITDSVTINGTTGGSTRVEIRGPGGPLVSGDHGLTVTGNNVHVRGLVITSAADNGILVSGSNFSLTGSYIGVFSDGVIALPNQGFGVQVQGSMAVIGGETNGGPCTGDCNVISGAINEKANVFLDVSSSLSVVKGNFIGTDVTGTTTLTPNIGNGQGVADRGSGNLIGGSTGTTPGGSCTGDCNLISGNSHTAAAFAAGLLILSDAQGTVVRGNFIGTDVTGTQPLGNGLFGRGLISRSPTAMIGGLLPADRNVISGNYPINLLIEGLASPGSVLGNYIGPDTSGTTAVENIGTGVWIEGNGATIGGVVAGAGNVISGNGTGVALENTVNAQIQGNLIGTAADGVSPLRNELDAIVLFASSSNNIIGGFTSDAANTIAFNNGSGVVVDGSFTTVRSNTIRHNSIHSNVAKGIDLVGTGNDALPPPVITGENPLSGTACSECFVDIYSDNEDEGRTHEGWVLSDIAGNWTFPGLLNGPNVTATNTDNSDNTSEFSAPFTVTGPTPTPSPTPTGAGDQRIWGDHNCSGAADPVDALLVLRHDAGLTTQTNECPEMGAQVDVTAVAVIRLWGDLDCSGAVDPVDALKGLRFDAALPITQSPGCPDAGQQVIVVT
ncbi:MAG TPA: right-handed parallel beta-helix repeat-containing protein [Dehalococcoidia bacterium]|nr:right-handed parallel beta-helix repeat-containing protein [Dehalococcoidia bacterium]